MSKLAGFFFVFFIHEVSMTTEIQRAEVFAQPVWPARKVVMVFEHPAIGCEHFSPLIAAAMAEYHQQNPRAMETAEPFVSSQGVTVRYHGLEQLDREAATGKGFTLYRGCKSVLARPMTRGEYNTYRGWQLPPDESPDDAGYLVEYVDGGKANDSRHAGYISWSPKDVFDRSYHQI